MENKREKLRLAFQLPLNVLWHNMLWYNFIAYKKGDDRGSHHIPCTPPVCNNGAYDLSFMKMCIRFILSMIFPSSAAAACAADVPELK